MAASAMPPSSLRPAQTAGLRITIVAAVLLALVLSTTDSHAGPWWRFSTFTYQANLFAAAYFVWALWWPGSAQRLPGLRGAVVLYVVVAGVMWNLFLAGMSMGYTAQNILLHVVSPILVVADWLLIGRGQDEVAWWHPLVWLGYPLLYLVASLTYLNSQQAHSLYYFLDIDRIGMTGLARNVALLAIAFAVLGYLVLGMGRLASAARRSPA